MEKEISRIKANLVKKIGEYIQIIKAEFGDKVKLPHPLDLENRVHIEETGTISLYIKNGHFYFPLSAFKVLDEMKKDKDFGILPNHKLYDETNIILNDNTFYDYIQHAKLAGLTVEEYYNEALLHETMHFCGCDGAKALREGLTELKTRMLAKKYGLRTTACGYPKEVKIVHTLQEMWGEDVLSEIAFSGGHQLRGILDKISPSAFDFYIRLNEVMEKEFNTKYYTHKYPGADGPFEKVKRYNEIDYTKAYELINEYQNKELERKQHGPVSY